MINRFWSKSTRSIWCQVREFSCRNMKVGFHFWCHLLKSFWAYLPLQAFPLHACLLQKGQMCYYGMHSMCNVLWSWKLRYSRILHKLTLDRNGAINSYSWGKIVNFSWVSQRKCYLLVLYILESFIDYTYAHFLYTSSVITYIILQVQFKIVFY